MTNLQVAIAVPLASLISSIVTSYITVRLSMRQFHSEKWWEKKDKAYSHIMEKLSELQYSLRELFDYAMRVKDSSEERKRLEDEYKQAKESVRKIAAIGAYAISKDAADALEILVRDLQQIEFGGVNYPSDNLERWYVSTTQCIKVVRECSGKELSKK